MKYEKELELSGMTSFSDKPVWTVEQLSDHLKAETPEGWLVESFRVTVVPGSKRAAQTPALKTKLREKS